MPVAFVCPACHEPVSVSRRYAGSRGRCPRCAVLVDVPPTSTAPLPDGVVETDDVPAPPALLAATAPAPELPTGSLLGLGGLGLLLGAGLAAGALQLRRAPAPELPPAPITAAETPGEDLLAPLRAALATLQARAAAAAGQDLAPLRAELDRLCRTPLCAEEAGALARVGLRLSGLAATAARGDADGPPAWIVLQREAVRRVAPLAEEAPTGLRARASVRLGHPRRGLVRAVALASGPEALTAALVDPRWLGVLGPSGYDELQGLVSRSPEADPELRPRLADLRARAAAYASALGEVTRAEGDPARARRAFESVLGDAGDPWPRATLEVLELLAGKAAAALAAAQAAAEASRLPPTGTSEARPVATEVGPATTDRGPRAADWRARFRALAKEHRSAQGARKGEVQAELTALVTGLQPQAKGDLAAVDAVVSVLDEAPQPFLADPALHAAREPLHAAWFEGSLARATGPMTFLRLDKWCVDFDHDPWRARLRPFLELLVAAKEPGQVDRERARSRRAQAVAAAAAFRGERADQLAQDLEELVDGLREQRFAPEDLRRELLDLVRLGVERVRPEAAARLKASILTLVHATPDDEKVRRAWRKALDKARGATSKRLLDAVDDCLEAGEPGLGFDLLGLLLQLDPNNARAHKGLGHLEVGGVWLREFDARRLEQGLAWSPQRAWVRKVDAARYDKGEHLDIQRIEWTTLAEAEARHAAVDDPWVVDTEHFRLHSTARLARTAAVATRLEAFYLAVFRQYDLFFAQRGAALVFGVAPTPKRLEVWFYADREQYLTHAKGVIPGSAGFYSSGSHASYFYDSGEDYSTLQHELVHQVLGESSPNGSAPAWLAEGAAVLLQDARFEDGVLVVGGVSDNARISEYARSLAQGRPELSLLQITQLTSQADWNRDLSASNYKAAGATLHFLCHFDGGRYRGDLVEMIKDAYWSRPTALQNSFGLPPAALDAMMRRFYGAR